VNLARTLNNSQMPSWANLRRRGQKKPETKTPQNQNKSSGFGVLLKTQAKASVFLDVN
jgi:hypothetical protein